MSHAKSGNGSVPDRPQPKLESSESYVPSPRGLFGAGRFDGVNRERQAAAAQIQRTVKAWRSASGPASGRANLPRGGGEPLSPEIRKRMEPKLGAPLGDVKIHTGGDSGQAAKAMGARAFTVGNAIHFNQGQYSPGEKQGDRLLAHELTHVVQGQKSGVQRQAEEGEEEKDGPEVSHPEEPAEKEADAVSEDVAEKLHGGEESAESDDAKPAQISTPLAGVGRKAYLDGDGAGTSQDGSGLKPASSASKPEGETTTSDLPATEQDRAGVRDKLDEWRTDASSALEGYRQWWTGNWTDFYGKASSNPHLGWAEGALASFGSNAAGNILTEVGSKWIKKGAAAAAGLLVGANGGPPGAVIGFLIGTLVETLASAAFEQISGKADADQNAAAAADRTAALIAAMHKSTNEKMAAAKQELTATHGALLRNLAGAKNQETCTAISAWERDEQAKMKCQNVDDRSLFKQMLSDWILENAKDPRTANDETSQAQWENAFDAVGMDKLHPKGHPGLFGYQTRAQLRKAGLPTNIADTMIEDANASMPKGPEAQEATARKYANREYTITVADDPDRLAAFLGKNKVFVSNLNLDFVRAGKFSIKIRPSLAIGMEQQTGRKNCQAYVSFWEFTVSLTDKMRFPPKGEPYDFLDVPRVTTFQVEP